MPFLPIKILTQPPKCCLSLPGSYVYWANSTIGVNGYGQNPSQIYFLQQLLKGIGCNVNKSHPTGPHGHNKALGEVET